MLPLRLLSLGCPQSLETTLSGDYVADGLILLVLCCDSFVGLDLIPAGLAAIMFYREGALIFFEPGADSVCLGLQ